MKRFSDFGIMHFHAIYYRRSPTETEIKMLSLLADALMIATRQQPFHREPQQRHGQRWAIVDRKDDAEKVR